MDQDQDQDLPDPLSLSVFQDRASTSASTNGHSPSSVRERLASSPSWSYTSTALSAAEGPVPSVFAGPTGKVRATAATDRGAAAFPDGVDWQLVAVFRAQVSDRLTRAVSVEGGGLTQEAERELGRAIIQDVLLEAAAEAVSQGQDSWDPHQRAALATAVFNAVFGLGRLQPLVDDDTIENIMASGYDNVWLELTDGSIVRGPAIADSDEELLDFLAFLGTRSEVNARPFSSTVPKLHMRLDGGARLAVAAWVTPRPSVVIRRHRLSRVTLDDLVARGSLSPVAASFLAAAIKAKKSVVVSGPQGAGKTTMLRALCSEIDYFEVLGTFETEYELHLHQLRDQHFLVHAWEARPGSGEVNASGKSVGEYTLDEALYDSFRFNLARQIIGEVRGPEFWAMIKAMESGAGSLSTTHARDAGAAIRKLVTCAMEAGPHVTRELATSKIADSLDIVVQLHLRTVTDANGSRRQRWVSEIDAIGPSMEAKGYTTTHVFRPRPDGPAVADTLPDELRELASYGFDLAGYTAEAEREGTPS